MTYNDILRSIRYMMAINDSRMAEIAGLAGLSVPLEQMASFLKIEGEEGYAPCDHKTISYFLNGLVILKRGKDETKPPMPIETIVTNNTVLKKMRVAFQLKDEDVIQILGEAGFKASKSEVNALFRKEDQPNFRLCGDQVLRYFLKGLSLKFRG